MLEISESQQTLLAHEQTQAGPIPTVLDPDGVYPFPSFVETAHRPVLKSYRFIALENDQLRVTVCPDLGGKVHSLLDKRSAREILFIPASVCPVRILPRLGFIPGGIEVSFPISHSPVQLEPVHYRIHREDDRLYLWCGERELHSGMQWTVEYSLSHADTFLTQRTCFRNRTTQARPWMSWSNAALPARPDTEFHFPNGPVLYHGAELKTIDWASQGPRLLSQLQRMAGFFWINPDAQAFGAFTPSLGHGLYHIADPASAPGMKLWSYGVGPDQRWGRAASLSGEEYLEIQGGPIRDQSLKAMLQPGQVHSHTEYWLPSAVPLDIHSIRLPTPGLVSLDRVPAFDWPMRAGVQCWLSLLGAHKRQSLDHLPTPPPIDSNLWAPSAMEQLGPALRWAASVASGQDHHTWLFQLGAWLAAQGKTSDALAALKCSSDDRSRALAARIQLRAGANPTAARDLYHAIESPSMALHPQVFIERDLALAALGPATLAEREQWFDRVSESREEWVLERKAAFLLDQGRPEKALALLQATDFQLVHQRYVRTALWRRLTASAASLEAAPPKQLGEDDLAAFGAYRMNEA